MQFIVTNAGGGCAMDGAQPTPLTNNNNNNNCNSPRTRICSSVTITGDDWVAPSHPIHSSKPQHKYKMGILGYLVAGLVSLLARLQVTLRLLCVVNLQNFRRPKVCAFTTRKVDTSVTSYNNSAFVVQWTFEGGIFRNSTLKGVYLQNKCNWLSLHPLLHRIGKTIVDMSQTQASPFTTNNNRQQKSI